ncbi:hypothetical protein E4S40_04640 [Algoriphagus kandeliae]|uniref:Transglutaminase-like domain-containing protein n=1 Tax=Algoriphagus kandeliae TaxID=2562278 RepID=A0A4Y9QSQ4_9BACT|nr:hypothetical protein [Algoriphagus kandeliae]TFV95514.1 hypothetical protein E4S40_04640 [Algoriphagus kandeliae]
MQKWVLLFGLISLLSLSVIAQEGSIQTEKLPFESPTEQEFWKKGISENDQLSLLMAVRPSGEEPLAKWEEFLAKLDQKFEKKGKSLAFLRYAFQTSHQKLFKKYEQHATFNQMLSEGKFDCVSGTAVLGLLLNRYGFDHEIIETDYHVFSIVKLEEKPIILESTLKVGGMITRPSEVKNYLNAYKPEESATYLSLNQRIGSLDIDYSDKTIFRSINLRELAGLQYYNDAIFHFNRQAYRISEQQLVKAYQLYPSERIDGLRELTIDQAYKTLGIDLRK